TLVNGVSISWETANAKDYTLSGSVNGTDWVVIQTLTNMATGPRIDIFNGIDTQYRYLKMDATARNTDYGYSIFEFDVCVPEVPVESLVCESPVFAATATASTGDGIAAVDGIMGTRWESAASDLQSLTVDMGEVDAIDFVKIYWETANAKNYTLKGSVDGTNWTLISTKTNMPTGTRTDGILVGGNYRYLKVDCTLRNTGYGYSIWEFEVCGQVSYTPVPALLQAEDWYQMSGVVTEPTEDANGGVDVGYIDANDWMDYPIDVTIAGQYTINSRIASLGEGGIIEYLLDGVSLGTISLPNTGGWQVWQTVSLTVNLPAGDHMLRLRAVSPPFNINWIDIEANFIVWNGATWDNGTPAEGVDAVINGSYSGNGFNVSNLTVNAGKTLTITGGNTVTVNSQLTNNGGIIVQNNAALVQPNGGTYTGTGSFTAHRNSNPLYRLDYTLWGAPVSAQQLQAFSPNTISNRFYTYAYNWNASSSPSYREQYFATNAQNNFIPGKAYLIRMPDFLTDNANYAAGTANHAYDGTFTGMPNNGPVAVGTTVTNLNGGGTLSQTGRYIAVANPYPSPISVKEFFTQNSAVLEAGNGMYFWRKKNDAAANSYAHLSLLAYTQNSGAGGDIDGGGATYYTGGDDEDFNANWIISPGQGFLVKLKTGLDNTATVNFANSMRKPAQSSQPFFKTANTNDAPTVSRLWLNLTNTANTVGATAFSQAAIGYLAQATLDLDYGYDAKILGDGNAKLYSKAADNNLAIQARPTFANTDVVPMGFAVTAGGEYTISLDHFDGLFSSGQEVYLKDNLAGTVTNLNQNPYLFTTDPGTFDTRFEVLYMPQGQLGTDVPALANMVMVYQQNGAINISTGTIQMTDVTVYDIRGRKLYSKSNINATETTITGLTTANGVLIVEINTPQGKVSKKIIY
ncbi:MAG: carbohydrate-binding protein, partial [Bacteroidota bacterium]